MGGYTRSDLIAILMVVVYATFVITYMMPRNDIEWTILKVRLERPYQRNIWDCSNMSLEAKAELEKKGYVVWYSKGCYSDYKSCHAWVSVVTDYDVAGALWSKNPDTKRFVGVVKLLNTTYIAE